MLVEVDPLIVTPTAGRGARREGDARRERDSAIPSTPRCATPAAEDPQEQLAKSAG